MMIMVGGIDVRIRRERVVKRTVQDQVKDERAELAKITGSRTNNS